MKKLLLLLVFISGSASAQQWPSKPIRYIVPFPPGAFNDTLARTLAAELPKTLGQPVIVDNRPGGNTIIGTELAAKSPPDGYTLFGAALALLRDPEPVQDLVRRDQGLRADHARRRDAEPAGGESRRAVQRREGA